MHTQLTFNGPLSGTTRVIQFQKAKTNLDFTKASDSEWQGHQLFISNFAPQTDNQASIPHLKVYYRPGALPASQPTVSKH